MACKENTRFLYSGFSLLEMVFALFLSSLIIWGSWHIISLLSSIQGQVKQASRISEAGIFSTNFLRHFVELSGLSKDNFVIHRDNRFVYPLAKDNILRVSYRVIPQISQRDCLNNTLKAGQSNFDMRFTIRPASSSSFNTPDFVCHSYSTRRSQSDLITDLIASWRIMYVVEGSTGIRYMRSSDLSATSVVRAVRLSFFATQPDSQLYLKSSISIPRNYREYSAIIRLDNSDFLP